jgi:putative DNA primase/helicase
VSKYVEEGDGMKNKSKPRVGPLDCNMLTKNDKVSYNLNSAACDSVEFADLSENELLSCLFISDNESHERIDPRTFKNTAIKTLTSNLNIKTIESGEILIYDTGVYRNGGQRKLESLIQSLADELGLTVSNNLVAEIVGAIKRKTYSRLEDFDKEPMRMSFHNGILDLKTMILEPHDPKFLTLIQIPWDYDPSATCPNIERVVEEICGKENVDLIYEVFGHFLVKDYRFKRFTVLVGRKDSGKSTLLRLMSEYLGEDNISSVGLQNLSDRFMKAELVGKLANIADDLPKGRIKDSSILKQLSGRSRIQAERKGKDPFGYTNFAKLVFSSNYFPSVDNPTDADSGRFMIIELNSEFGDPGKKDEVKPKDPNLLEDII